MDASAIVDHLLRSDEPSVRWKVRVGALGEDPESRTVRRLQDEIRRSPRARRLIEGHAELRPACYAKWQGSHWVLASLADLGYPSGDDSLLPMRDQLLRTWLTQRYYREFEDTTGRGSRAAVPVRNGRYRRCGSQQGSALLSVVRLGLEDEGSGRLVERLLHWQWPDGGWNCDRAESATSSSAHETLLPMRGLAAYATTHRDDSAQAAQAAQAAADRAAEVFLSRRLLFRRSTGTLIHSDWAALHYPRYWHYDVLAGLKGLAEVGRLGDARCQDALDLLESKRLPDGGWPAEARYYRGTDGLKHHNEHVGWGGVDKRRTNEWVTVDALAVLASAGRLD